MKKDVNDYRTGRHVVYELHAHIVLTPKYRRKVMTPAVSACLEQVTRDTCERFDVILEEFNTDLDHVHLVINYPPKISISTLIGAIKTNTSRVIRATKIPEVEIMFWGKHFWSPSYFVVSTGGAPLERIKEYVRQQGRKPRKPGRPRDSSPPSRTRVSRDHC